MDIVAPSKPLVANGRRNYARIGHVLDMPNLIQMQVDSFERFKKEGLRELLEEISPIQDFTGSKMELQFADYEFGEPKYTEWQCRERDMTYSAPLRVKTRLIIKGGEFEGEIREKELFMGDFPMMTDKATFVIHGAERVVVSQLVRSPGVYFTREEDPTSGRPLAYGKLIPNRGAWLEFETSNKDVLSVKIDRKRKIPVTTLLRAISYHQCQCGQFWTDSATVCPSCGAKAGPPIQYASDEALLELFAEEDNRPEHHYIQSTLDREPAKSREEALIEFYRRLRPGDPPTIDNARNLLDALFFNKRRYDLGRVGRHKLNKRLRVALPLSVRTLAPQDLIAIVRHLILLNNGRNTVDDIDHLGNRRVRAVGELIQNQFRVGLLRMERVVRERMTITDPTLASPELLLNIRPIVAAIKEFFGGSQLSQFMDQTNPLAEITHKRRLSALGPGGLSRDRAGFDVRDVHFSHYGRICPIETPEGPNIGLIGSLATYARINEFGFIETPYRKVVRSLPNDAGELLGREIREAVARPDGTVVAEAGIRVDGALLERLQEIPAQFVAIRSYVSEVIEYLPADTEESYIIAQANALLDERSEFLEEKVEARHGDRFLMEPPDRIDYMDVSPKQIMSVATSLIPFLEHDDANRALMGSNMQRQAVPLLRPESPLIGTGIEKQVARDSGQMVIAQAAGAVVQANASEVVVRRDDGEEDHYDLKKFVRTNQATCFNQRPIVRPGDRVERGQVLADSSSTDSGELALGQNILCAFMSWEGYNFEDAIIISEKLLRDDKFTSIHIEKHEVEARDTKLGPEEITRDIPNVGDESLRNLDDEGVIRIGAEVGPGDLLVGKLTPKGETELTAEEKLLRAIFGEKAREVKDTCLRVPHGEWGKVIAIRQFSRAAKDELAPGVNQVVRVSIGQKRKVAAGDKMAGRHGNKGVVARILPEEDMPFLADGRTVEMILNPIGVPSRMNVGQILETHLGWAADSLGFRVVTPVFDGAREVAIEDALARRWVMSEVVREQRLRAPDEEDDSPGELELHEWLTAQGLTWAQVFDESREGSAKEVCLRLWLRHQGVASEGMDLLALEGAAERLLFERGVAPPTYGRAVLCDGRTGQPFDQPVTVGYLYMMKLVHLVEDKIHARSTGPYSLITQQPLGGKAQFGGQRFGEMEVWALEAAGAAHILQEILTVKSDDVAGRVKTYESIVKGEGVLEPGVPESFKVLVKELQSLALSVEVLNEAEEKITFPEDTGVSDFISELGINISGPELDAT